ncbi:MAG: alpha/beta hydrolase [Verrucomicrobiota bacterium]
MASKKDKLLNVGLGAGLLGGLLLALKYAVRRPTKSPVPDTISPAIFATRVLQTSYGPVVYHESGSGQPLLFIHNISPGASSYEWSKVYPDFAGRFRVLALDMIGFGESARPDAQLGAEDCVRVLAEFIRATCWEQMPVVIGSGLGAGFCAYLASQHPELVSRLILFMPTGRNDIGQQRLPLSIRMLSRMPLLNRFAYRNYQSTKTAMRLSLAQSAFFDPSRLTDETVDVFTTCAQQYGAEHAIFNFYTGRFNFDLDSRMKSVTQPVSLLWSEQAVSPPIDTPYHFQKLLSNGSVGILKNTGTLAAIEDPAQMSACLQELLTEDLHLFKAE